MQIVRLRSILLLLPGALLPLAFCTAQPIQPNSQGAISGTVRNQASNTPADGVDVFATANGKRMAAVVTDKDGVYSVDHLDAGIYRITVVAQGGLGSSSSRLINLAPGQNLSSINIDLPSVAELEGTVTDEARHPLKEITVFLLTEEVRSGALRTLVVSLAKTDEAGHYAFHNVQPRYRYRLFAQVLKAEIPAISKEDREPSDRPLILVSTWYPAAIDAESATPLAIRGGEHLQAIDIQMRHGSSYCVEGVLRTGTGEGRLNFQLFEGDVFNGSSSQGEMFVVPPHGMTAADGKIRLCDLHSGAYQLLAFRGGPKGRSASFFGAASILVGHEDVHGLALSISSHVALNGRVSLDDSAMNRESSSRVSITLDPTIRPPFFGEMADLQTNSLVPGSFEFPPVLVDKYAVHLQGVPEDLYVRDILLNGVSVRGHALSLGDSVGSPDLHIILGTRGGIAEVAVADRKGVPAPGVSVRLVPAEARSEADIAAQVTSGETDQNGVYRSALIAPGDYYAMADGASITLSALTLSRLSSAAALGKKFTVAPKGRPQVSIVVDADIFVSP